MAVDTAEPVWLARLRAEVARSSQRRVAEALRGGNGYPSEALLSQVLAGKYAGRSERLQRLVEGYYLGSTVACPVLGDITRDRCDHAQRSPFAPSNWQRIALFRACRTCAHRTTDHATDHPEHDR